MENVSKALIIAGAILLAILLITLGIFIFNSTKGVNEEASVVGELIELKASDTVDIIEGYTVNRYADENVNIQGYHYIDYYTGIKIEENVTYIISFDYIIHEKESDNINCGIGVGINNPKKYNKDFVWQVKYPNQNIGEKTTFVFILKPNEYEWFEQYKNENLYLSLRLARTYPASNFKVNVENIKIKYKSE